MDGQGRVVELLQRRLEGIRHAAHLAANLQHELLVLVELHGRLHAVLLDLLPPRRE